MLGSGGKRGILLAIGWPPGVALCHVDSEHSVRPSHAQSREI